MIEWLLRWATRVISVPILQAGAYGPIGRFVKGTFSKIRMSLARFRKVPIEQFNGSYFYPETKRLQVSVTNVCNARCSFCAYRIVADSGRPAGIMKMDVFKKALDEY